MVGRRGKGTSFHGMAHETVITPFDVVRDQGRCQSALLVAVRAGIIRPASVVTWEGGQRLLAVTCSACLSPLHLMRDGQHSP